MGKILVLAEKPSVARDIARVLGAKTRMEGALGGEKYIVTWAIGHLVSLCEPEELDDRYKKWRMEDLPILPGEMKTRVLPKTRAQFSVVKKLLNQADVERVVCATDSGREGELIFRYIYQMSGCKKPVDRLWISSMTDAAIRAGFEALRPDSDYDALYESARRRAEADWLVGMNASRAFSLRYDALLSVGRVQTPTLKLIVSRDAEIAAFEPRDYYELRANFGDYAGLWFDPKTNEARIYDAQRAARIKKQILGKTAEVTDFNRERRRTPPPPLFDLTALQREANRVMGVSASKTLSIAQSLYETRKLITYPRTDSRYLPRDMIGPIKNTLRALSEPYAALAAPILDAPPPFGRVYNDKKVSDHHAIVPTGHRLDLGRLSADERRLFDLIARRLICVFYPDYEYESVNVTTRVEEHLFRTSGQTPLVEGWRALYRGEKSEKGEKGEKKEEAQDAPVPPLAPGDTRRVEGASLKKQKTRPPQPHTDASLLQLMEHAGRLIEDEALKESMKDSALGTPATRAAIIERLIAVGYAARRGKTLISTEKGRRLIEVAPPEIASPEMTGKWEKALSVMAREDSREQLNALSARFIESIRRYCAFLVEAARTADARVVFEKEPRRGRGKGGALKRLGRPCPVCGRGEVVLNSRAFGCSRWKEGCAYTVWRDALKRRGGPEITQAMMLKLLDGQSLQLPQGRLSLSAGQIVFTAAQSAPEPEKAGETGRPAAPGKRPARARKRLS